MKHSRTVISFPYDMACDIKYLPTKRHKKPHTIRGSHRVMGEVPVVEEKDFPVAFKVKKYRTVCPKAKTQEDLAFHESKNFPNKSGHMPIQVRAYKGRFYRMYQYGFGAVETTCGVKTIEALNYEAKWRFRDGRGDIEMTPPETGKFLTDCIQRDEDIQELANRQKDDVRKFKEFCGQFVSFKGKLWEECGEPYYHYLCFGMGHGNGSTGFFVDFELGWLAWHSGYLVYNAFHREQCLEDARKHATMRHDDLTYLKNPKENIEILRPDLVKIKENIY